MEVEEVGRWRRGWRGARKWREASKWEEARRLADGE
jgi:hypothetical protein